MQEASSAFRTDLDAAGAEIATLRSAAIKKPQGCDFEAQTLAKSPY